MEPNAQTSKKKELSQKGRRKADSFEESYSRLQKLIAEIEGEDVPLEELVNKFEEGVKLLQKCWSLLESARLRVEEFVEKGEGGYRLKGISVPEADES